MRTNSKITFISPVGVETVVVDGKRQRSPHFFLLQAGSDPLKLEYASKGEARLARGELLLSEDNHAIHTMELFWAIRDALAQVIDA